jgi:hypothetical protein
MDAANLTPTLLPLNGRPSSSQTLIATALRWIRAQGASRVVTDLPQHRIATRTVLESMGFAEQFQLHTLAKKL